MLPGRHRTTPEAHGRQGDGNNDNDSDSSNDNDREGIKMAQKLFVANLNDNTSEAEETKWTENFRELQAKYDRKSSDHWWKTFPGRRNFATNSRLYSTTACFRRPEHRVRRLPRASKSRPLLRELGPCQLRRTSLTPASDNVQKVPRRLHSGNRASRREASPPLFQLHPILQVRGSVGSHEHLARARLLKNYYAMVHLRGL